MLVVHPSRSFPVGCWFANALQSSVCGSARPTLRGCPSLRCSARQSHSSGNRARIAIHTLHWVGRNTSGIVSQTHKPPPHMHSETNAQISNYIMECVLVSALLLLLLKYVNPPSMRNLSLSALTFIYTYSDTLAPVPHNRTCIIEGPHSL